MNVTVIAAKGVNQVKEYLQALIYFEALLSWRIYPIIAFNKFITLLCGPVKSNDLFPDPGPKPDAFWLKKYC